MLSSKAARNIAKKEGDFDIFVDLKLDSRLKPLPLNSFKKRSPSPRSSEELAGSLLPGKTHAIGSGKPDDQVYYQGDVGLFGCIFEAWKNHWILRTRPEDWWFPVACRIAKGVDAAAKPRSWGSEKVRDMFVSHEGKENIQVELPVYTIYEADYDFLFNAFSSKIGEKIKVPEFAKVMQNDFGTSGPAHKIASQVNLMSSMQEFFTYEMYMCGCGLRGLEMAGSVEDWASLSTKAKQVRETLKPIEREIGLGDAFWENVLDVYQNLANTRKNPSSPAVAKFWINILMDTTGKKWVGGGGSMPGRPVEVKAYNGWLVRFLTGKDQILAEDLKHGGSERVREKLSGWNQVPMKVSLTWCSPPIQDTSTLVAGIIGYKLHKGAKGETSPYLVEEGGKSSPSSSPRPSKFARLVGALGGVVNPNDEVVPSLEPYHVWAMLLPPDSPARG